MTNSDLSAFAKELFQDVQNEAVAIHDYAADVFFEKYTEYLMEAGEIQTADRAYYDGPSGQGIRVDGYGGDPIDTSDHALCLIISDFCQSLDLEALNKREMEAMFKRLLKFLKKSLDVRWRKLLEETSPAFGLADLIAERWKIIGKVRLFLISNRELRVRVDRIPGQQLGGKEVTHSVWDIRRLHRFANSGSGREDIEIDLEKGEYGGAIPILPVKQHDTRHRSYLSVIPGQVLAKIYDQWDARLLENNVRVFLQARGKVNKGIKNTLESEPSMFFAYNNGITATAEEVIVKKAGGHSVLSSIKNMQIVNGGQTTASIHTAYRNNVDLSGTYVPMKLSVIDQELTTRIVPKISEYANSQNRINASDFYSNHPFHVRVEEFSRRMFAPNADGEFKQSKWFYERARGQYASVRALLKGSARKKFDSENPRLQRFTKTDLAKFLGVWECKPERVSLGAQKNFVLFAKDIGRAWKKSADDFNKAWYRAFIAKAIVFKRCERIVSKASWYHGGYRANIVAYTIAKLADVTSKSGKSVDFQRIWQRQDISSSMAEMLSAIGNEVCQILLHPPEGISNVTEWAKKQACWSGVQGIPIELGSHIEKDLVSRSDEIEAQKKARKEQREYNEIESQMLVTVAGAEFWRRVVRWARKRKLLTPRESRALKVAVLIPRRVPTSKQSVVVLKCFRRLQNEGFEEDLPRGC